MALYAPSNRRWNRSPSNLLIKVLFNIYIFLIPDEVTQLNLHILEITLVTTELKDFFKLYHLAASAPIKKEILACEKTVIQKNLRSPSKVNIQRFRVMDR